MNYICICHEKINNLLSAKSATGLQPTTKINSMCLRGLLYVQKVLCSEGPMFIRFYIQKVLCSDIFVQKVLCSESTGDYLSVPIGHTTLLRLALHGHMARSYLFRGLKKNIYHIIFNVVLIHTSVTVA